MSRFKMVRWREELVRRECGTILVSMADSITRRQLAIALAAAPCAFPAPQPSAPASVSVASKDLANAREQYRKHTVKLAAIEIPMATEPACHFKA